MATFTIDGGWLRGKPFPKRMSADQALDLSIEAWALRVKWHSKAKRGERLNDWGHCALCEKYGDCFVCPFAQKHCREGVFSNYNDAANAGNNSKAAKLATKMLNALKESKVNG